MAKLNIINNNKNVCTKMSFTLIHWNCNSINNKIGEFKQFCYNKKPHIISLNEKKVTNDRASYLLQIDNYILVHKSRSDFKNGAGGVALLVRKDIKFGDCKILDALNLEVSAIKVKINNKEINIVSYYNPPNQKINDKIFEILIKDKDEFILMGDLNAKLTLYGADKNNDNGNILENLILENDCMIANNNEPTHVCFNGKTSSVLDYCIISTTLYDTLQDYSVLKDDDMTSDHLPYSITLTNNVISYKNITSYVKTKANNTTITKQNGTCSKWFYAAV